MEESKPTLTAKEKIAQEKDFWLIKSIRQYPDPYAFWRFEAQSLTITAKTPEFQSKRPLRYGGEENLYTLRIDGVQKVKAEPLYEKKEKWGFSKHKSMTAVSTTHKFCPPAFSFNLADINSVEVGYMLPAESDYALIRRILQTEGGTIHRNFRYKTERKAKAALEEGLNNNTIFTSLSALASKGAKTRFNEAMVHAKWGPKAKIAYFRDNLPSKMRAISLAHDMSLRLRQQRIENGEEIDEIEDSKISKDLPKVEICSYLPEFDNESAEIAPYDAKQQEKDIDEGLKSEHLITKAFACFVELQKNNFKRKEDDKEIGIDELEIFIKLAADLSYESSILFFENFFLPQQDKIKGNLARTNKLHLLRDVFRCVPLEERSRLIYPLLNTPADELNHSSVVPIPTLRGYYLHSLLRFDCLEHDTNEFLEKLETWLEKNPGVNLEVWGEYKQSKQRWKIVDVQDRDGNTPLHLAAAKNKKSIVEYLLQNRAHINAKNKDRKTACDLAFELDHMESGYKEFVNYLLDRGGTFKDDRSLLHMVVWKNKMDIVQSIMNRLQSDILSSSNKHALINCRDRYGITPLHLAAEAGNYEMVKCLVENGALSYPADDGRTPLCYTDSPAVAQLLIQRGEDVSRQYYDPTHERELDPLSRAVITGNIEMIKVLSGSYNFRPGRIFSAPDSGENYLAKAIAYNRVVAVDFLIGLGIPYSSNSNMQNFEWFDNPLLYNAIKNKNDTILDFLLTKDTYPFPPPFYCDRITIALFITPASMLVYFSSPKVQELITPFVPEDYFSDYANGIVTGLSTVLSVFALFYLLACLYQLYVKRIVDEKVTEYRASKTENPLRGYTFIRFGLSPDASVEETVSHLGKLPLREAVTQLLNIAEVDPKFALYSIIRLFNSDTQKASEILYHISQSQLSKENFLKLFDEPCSDEREVLIGCIKERIQTNNVEEAQKIFLMFSGETRGAFLEKIDYQKLYPPLDAKPVPQLNFGGLQDSKSFPLSSSRDILLPKPKAELKEKKLSMDDFPETYSHTSPLLTSSE